jgi:hypothetical protein
MSTKVKSITPKTYEGKVTGHTIVLEDGTQGYLDDKGSAKELKVGEDVIYILVVKQNKQGKDYNLLTLKRTQSATSTPPAPAKEEKKDSIFKNAFSASSPQTKEGYKVQAAIEATRFVFDAFSAERIDGEQIKEFQRKAVTILWDEIDEIFKDSK